MADQTSTSKQQPTLILGCSNWGTPSNPNCRTTTTSQGRLFLETLTTYGYHTIDTSQHYPSGASGTSEELIGRTLEEIRTSGGDATSILVDTKVTSAPAGAHRPESLRSSIAASLAALKLPAVETMYLHFPDRSVPLSDPVSALSDAVHRGQAKRWGISNYTLAELQEILQLCDGSGGRWIRPAIYQGEYNPLNRENEALVRYCHEQGVAFYAFSPAASGVFSPTGSKIKMDGLVGDVIRQRYGNEAQLAAVQRVRKEAQDRGLGGHEVAIRWTVWDGVLDGKFGDAVVIGASSPDQLKQTCEFVKKGGLAGQMKTVVDGVWEGRDKEQ